MEEPQVRRRKRISNELWLAMGLVLGALCIFALVTVFWRAQVEHPARVATRLLEKNRTESALAFLGILMEQDSEASRVKLRNIVDRFPCTAWLQEEEVVLAEGFAPANGRRVPALFWQTRSRSSGTFFHAGVRIASLRDDGGSVQVEFRLEDALAEKAGVRKGLLHAASLPKRDLLAQITEFSWAGVQDVETGSGVGEALAAYVIPWLKRAGALKNDGGGASGTR